MGQRMNQRYTLKKGRVYEEWTCSCTSCDDHGKVYFRQRDEWPTPHMATTADIMELHGEEYHRTTLVRIFKPTSDITTSFEVVPTHKEAIQEANQKIDANLRESRTIVHNYKLYVDQSPQASTIA